MCSHGSAMTEQPVCFVGYSASDFAGSAKCFWASYPFGTNLCEASVPHTTI